MDRRRAFIDLVRVRTATFGASLAAAVLAIAVALTALTTTILLLAGLGVDPAPHALASAAQDAVVALYVVQLVGVSFFNHTAELRFATVPGLLLVGLSIVAAAAMAAKLVPGSARKKMTVALAMPVPYALLLGSAGLFVPLHSTAPGFGTDIAVTPSPVEAFLLPLGWGLLFASVGGMLGAFGRGWRRPAARLLGAWAAPLASSLRVLALAFTGSVVLAVFGVLAVAGGDLGFVVDGGFGHTVKVLGAGLLGLPTLAAAVLVSGFGVPFDWHVDALSQGQGSISAWGGALPSSNADISSAHGVPGVFALAPAIALAAVFAIGWLSARRSGPDAKLCLAGAVRAAALTTFAVWVLALLARVDAQAGGLLGFHLAADTSALLWRVPLLASVGCLAGGFACLAARGAASRRQLAATLLALTNPSHWSAGDRSRLGWVNQGLTWRAGLGLGFAAVPVLAIAMGAAGTVTSAAPPEANLAPIAEAAEQRLERASTRDEAVAVTANPNTLAIDTASVNTPLQALGIAPGKSRAEKAKAVLGSYGDLFGLSNPATELGNAEATTDKLGVTHVSFTQMAAGVPVYSSGISVHFSQKGEELSFISGSVIPDVSVAEDKAKLSAEQAVEAAKQSLPGGRLAQPASLQVYAGLPPYISGPDARLAWLVWLIGDSGRASKEYAVDAVTGKILDTISREESALDRRIYDAKLKNVVPGTLVRSEGQPPTADVEVNNAYDKSGQVYNFYLSNFERDSFDNQGAPLISTVNYAEASGAPFENAYWNGQQMVFGDNYTKALDIVGHEITHGVTEWTSRLAGSGEAGTLNESFSDIMGASIEAWATGEEEWKIGEDLPGGAIRNLQEPNEFFELKNAGVNLPDPKHLSEWVATCLDNFGIHINSTVTSHAFYLVASNLGIETAMVVFYRGWTNYLPEGSLATVESARAATLKAAKEYFAEGSTEYKVFENAFNSVGLNGTALPPKPSCPVTPGCSFARALKSQESVNGAASTLSMLSTLYQARGELALGSAAGDHFLPLYEKHMGRITELVDQDPALAEMSVRGLAEITPALEALMEGEGEKFELTPAQMKKIEVALKRLAQDDRLYGGSEAGELADLIDEELEWMALSSYGGMDYESGFERLNSETEANTTSAETGEVTDPQCTGDPYANDFAVNDFYVDTPGRHIPGQVSGLKAGGTACGTVVQAFGSWSTCTGKESLNSQISVQLPPGDKVNSTKNLANGSWVGTAYGHAIACAGEESRVIQGYAGLRSLSSWTTSQCPTAATACYEGRGEYEGKVGRSYAYVTESGGVATMTMTPIQVTVEGVQVPVGFGKFSVDLCARAGASGATSCGGATGSWIHQNGEAGEAGCPGGKGLYTVTAKNYAEQSTQPARECVPWEREARMQTIDAPNSLNAVSCMSGSTTCIASDSKGNAFYATNVSATAAATWTSWTGPGTSPSWALACPSTTLCLLADGEVAGGGGNVYKATALGGAFSTSFLPANGVGSISCPSSTFCVTAHEGGGFIRYSTNPSGISWTALAIGTGAMKGVSCLSNSFCAVVDGSGNVRVATTEARVKEASGYAATNVNGAKSLAGISCSSTTNCLAIDGSKEILKLTIAQPAGTATVSKVTPPGAGELTSVTCTGSTCVAVDASGGVFTSANGGTSWEKRQEAGDKLKSVSCASVWLCAAVNVAGDVVTFNPAPVAPNRTQTVSSGNVVNASSCIANSTTCVVSDAKGNAYYATNVNTRFNATWNLWSGPAEQSPSQAVACPSSTVCLLADGKSASGGNLYYASSLGGAFSTAYLATSGVDAISCPSASFCLAAENAWGRFRYSTTPASSTWTQKEMAESTEATAMKGVSCLSASFCAIADSKGNVYVANSAEKVQSTTWTKTNVDGTTALNGIACISTTLCIAVDAAGNVLRLTIDLTGKATAAKRNVGGTNEFTAIACTTTRCATVDNQGVVFVSASAGESWTERHDLPNGLTSVSCATNSLCIATDKAGGVTTFDAR